MALRLVEPEERSYRDALDALARVTHKVRCAVSAPHSDDGEAAGRAPSRLPVVASPSSSPRCLP